VLDWACTSIWRSWLYVNNYLRQDTSESVDERSERRGALVMPMLRTKGWTRCRWAAQAGVSKNSVYGYLSGERNLSVENRQALAEELGLKPEGVPD